MRASSLRFVKSASFLRFALAAGGLAAAGLLGLSAAALPAAAAHADDAACKALEAAMIANTKTPYHSYAKITFNYAAPMVVAERNLRLPASQSSETIFTGTVLYMRLLPGKWQALPTTPAQFQESVHSSVAGLRNCQHLADDKVDGAAVSVYAGVTQAKNGPVQTKVWVSAQGIPVKSETDIEIGHTPGGDMVHQHLSTRYEYGHIEAPSLTQ